MKIIILSTFLLTTLFSNAQLPDYLPESAQWRIDAIGLSSQYPCWYKDQMVCRIQGDSTIGNYTYKKIMSHALYTEYAINPGGGGTCGSPYIHDELYALIRQDSLRMYIYADNQDKLLYDFDLQVGDTLPLTYNNFSDTITVTSISTLQVGNETRKVFVFNNENEIDTLFEGIGHNWGFIGPMQVFEFYEIDLKCFSAYDTTWYPYLDAPCDLNVSNGKELVTENIQVFPNPTRSGWDIQFPDATDDVRIRLLSVSGEEQAVQTIKTGTNSWSISADQLNSGVYILQFQTINGMTALRVVKMD